MPVQPRRALPAAAGSIEYVNRSGLCHHHAVPFVAPPHGMLTRSVVYVVVKVHQEIGPSLTVRF